VKIFRKKGEGNSSHRLKIYGFPCLKSYEENEKENKMYEFANVSYKAMQEMPEGKEKAICYGVSGLLTDGGHHKQWAIEEMLKALGVDLNVLRKELRDDEYDWENGIAP